jgi:hypothetical protein
METNAKAALHVAILVAVAILMISPAVQANDLEADGQRKTPRALHFVLRHVDVEKVYWMTDLASVSGFNAIQVLVTDGVRLDSAPWLALDDAWTKQEFMDWVAHAHGKGMQIVPEVKLLTHQERLFQNLHSDLMYNKSTYDPRNDLTYKVVFELLDEIIEIVQPHALHIGHDEVAGHSKKSREKWLHEGEGMLPADLYLQDVLRIHAYLQERRIETWLWSDMLVSRAEFPNMSDAPLHGSMPGYGKALRDRIPREIVMCVWHYFDRQEEFETVGKLAKEGFRVIGASWKRESTMKNLSLFASENGANGMIATTWYLVQREQWQEVEDIIHESGKSFRRYFPDSSQ